jgi:glutathione S-transferase
LFAPPIWAKLTLLMADPVLFGAEYSVYTRIARLALIEKGVAYKFEAIDIFACAADHPYRRRQPFGRIPALEHDGFGLYETAAICRYVDEAFAGPALQPGDARGRARMAQAIGVLDSYAYRAMVWDVFVERVRKPARGDTPDEARIAAGLATAETCLGALAKIMGEGPCLAGSDLSLADLHAAPIVAYFSVAPEGAGALARHPSLSAWWGRIQGRASLAATPSPLLEQRGTS